MRTDEHACACGVPHACMHTCRRARRCINLTNTMDLNGHRYEPFSGHEGDDIQWRKDTEIQIAEVDISAKARARQSRQSTLLPDSTHMSTSSSFAYMYSWKRLVLQAHARVAS